MQNYQMTAADLEASMGEVYQATVQSGKPSRSWVWKIVGAIFFVALCSAVAVLFIWHFRSQNQREPTSALRSTAELPNTQTPAYQHPMLAQLVGDTKAAIHLHVSDQDHSPSLQWVDGVDQSFAMGGLKRVENAIEIPADGRYFVYSQASFNVPCESTETDGDDSTTLSYSIQWASPSLSSKEMPLLDGVKTVACQQNGENVYDIIYLGAVFKLYKGDKLSTVANNISYIDTQSSKTFFGVFQL